MAIYTDRWGGYRYTAAQALDWPRYEVERRNAPGGYASLPAYYDPTRIPPEVQRACAELALLAIDAPLNAELAPRVISETTGPISTTYDKATPEGRRFPAIDAMLAPVLQGGSGLMMIARG